MQYRMHARLGRALRRRVSHGSAAAALLVSTSTLLSAQVRPDSARSDSAKATTARKIEGVLVQAIRAGDAAPIAQKTITKAAIEQRHFGQDVPQLLMNAAPSMTSHTETGTLWGYSYLRLRGLDQTRINITIDGVPLNDPEDQVLYFADLADLMSSVHSVQVQRGVGTSTAGTASYAGSINFETTPVARRGRSGDAELQVGSFGAQRATVGFNTGLTTSGFAASGRVSALRTNGYRDHAGVMGRSGYLGAGWFGKQDIVKLTAIVGLLADTLSYTGATKAELAQNWRYNPLAVDERDKFGQQMVSLAWSHALTNGGTFNTTVYRNSAAGSYDYFDGADRYRFNLQHWWYGATSALNVERGDWALHTGLNANTYRRYHRGYFQPSTTLYDNSGDKQDASAFAKVTRTAGKAALFLDLQGRVAHFAYNPDQNAGIAIIRRALQAPIRQISENAGVEGSIVVDKVVNNTTPAWGFNALTEKYEDLIAAGVIDPTKVARCALMNAASVASLMLTTETLIAEKPKKESAAPMGGAPGMGGGYGDMM